MSEDLVVTKSAFPYQIAIFILLQIWALIGFEISQYQMVTLYEFPYIWFGWMSFLLVILIPILGLLIWKLKDRVQLAIPHWNFRIREVDENEYEAMIKDYHLNYRYILSSLDYVSFFVAILLYLGILFIPFILMRTNSFIIGLTPLILALMVMLFGLVVGIAIFKAIPNSATKEFPTHDSKKHRKTVQFLFSLPGIFWSGIRVNIGEDRGFYTIRDPTPIARIEGIESVAWMECLEYSRQGTSIIRSLLETGLSDEPILVGEIALPTNSVMIVELIKKTVMLYIEYSEDVELLEEVLEDITTFIQTQGSISKEKRKRWSYFLV
ncbi:hypothetical protein EU527_08580 [Candidatus Thorarchaeota archaeon]|nr:MAG: hypothetical protein EU527_08580 [Candidatus Thorarchaeota archaeon]